MLKGIDNRLNAEVLGCLRAMGHGDMLIVSDTNFPADSIARATVTGQLLRMENLTAAEAVEAILSVLPLDTFVDDFAGRMEVVGTPDEIPPVQAGGPGRDRPRRGPAAPDDRHRALRLLRPGARPRTPSSRRVSGASTAASCSARGSSRQQTEPAAGTSDPGWTAVAWRR